MSGKERRVYTCTVCGHQGVWSESWSWYGSYKQLDDGDEVVKTCSEKCRKRSRRRGGEG